MTVWLRDYGDYVCAYLNPSANSTFHLRLRPFPSALFPVTHRTNERVHAHVYPHTHVHTGYFLSFFLSHPPRRFSRLLRFAFRLVAFLCSRGETEWPEEDEYESSQMNRERAPRLILSHDRNFTSVGRLRSSSSLSLSLRYKATASEKITGRARHETWESRSTGNPSLRSRLHVRRVAFSATSFLSAAQSVSLNRKPNGRGHVRKPANRAPTQCLPLAVRANNNAENFN